MRPNGTRRVAPLLAVINTVTAEASCTGISSQWTLGGVLLKHQRCRFLRLALRPDPSNGEFVCSLWLKGSRWQITGPAGTCRASGYSGSEHGLERSTLRPPLRVVRPRRERCCHGFFREQECRRLLLEMVVDYKLGIRAGSGALLARRFLLGHGRSGPQRHVG